MRKLQQKQLSTHLEMLTFLLLFLLQRTLVGLVRDLRGIAFAFNAKTSFMMLFDWMYPYTDFRSTHGQILIFLFTV